jgi:hypothetical protein
MKLLPLLLVALCGCSGVKQLGSVGGIKYYQVKSQSIVGPNITMIVSENPQHEVVNETAASCTGIGSSVVNAAGNVGASAAFGLSLRPSKYNNNNTTTTTTDTTALGGSGTAAATGSGAVNSSTTGGDYTRVNGNSANAPGHNK